MRTCFRTEEDGEYRAARDLIVRRCLVWARDKGVRLIPDVVEAALQFRHECADGRLGFWRAREVEAFLLEWVPERVAAEPEDLACVPETLRALLRYLDAAGLRDPRAGALTAVEEAIDGARAAFEEAVRDPERYGVAKYWKLVAARHGIPLVDGLALERLKSGVSAGRIPHDRELLIRLATRTRPPIPRSVPAAPCVLPGDDELREAARRVPVVRALTALAQWAGPEGRALASSGALLPDDAEELVTLLEGAGVRGGPEWVPLLVVWAKRTRLVRVRSRRLSAVARAAPLLDDPLALWRAAFTVFPELAEEVCTSFSVLGTDFASAVPELLMALYGLPLPVPRHRVEDKVWGYCAAPYDLTRIDGARRNQWRDAMDLDLARTLRALGDLGVLEFHGAVAAVEGRVREGARHGVPGGVSLTQLAASAVRGMLLEAGRECGLMGELVGARPAELLGVVAEHYPADARRVEIRGWLAAHGHDVTALLDAVRACPFRNRALVLLDVLIDALAEGPTLLVSLRADPLLAPSALTSLLRRGLVPATALTPDEHLLCLTDGLLRFLEMAGPEPVRATLARDYPPPELALLAVDVLAAPHPDTAALADLRALVFEPLLEPRGRHAPHALGPSPG
ncbi:hypothetical protein LO762_02100 [Actinocorallia sp. API 0066]|uniref:hypothetical protein n=1 Tax=Actinocorallia sp. API 0066 TaxID=2896846 RepID=UPI001E41AE2A|nr:hypothetical protein [Actinocorallia sp. API 0066]MCD0447993.1 hypothetical protein [Actinocorallia sp. API 0066]